MKYFLNTLLLGLCYNYVCCAPKSLVLTRNIREVDEKEAVPDSSNEKNNLYIYQFDINSNISNRYAQTLVTSKVRNPDSKAKEATFTVILPEKAFISEFVMDIKGKTYKAYVKEKEEAKEIYDKAVASGYSSGLVAVSARDSNRFTVSVNVEPESKATFFLTYEELLERRNNQYELVLNIHPGQLVKDMNIEVLIHENSPLKFVRTPSLRSGNEISKNEENLDPSSDIQKINSTSSIVKFKPDIERQKKLSKSLGDKENSGLSGQFVVQYDVERDPNQGEVLLKDGYFVHFFAPENIEPLPKHVIFVLDTSGSMYGTKIDQLKIAMNSILDELREVDVFHIVEFNFSPFVWNIESETSQMVPYLDEQMFEALSKTEYAAAASATKDGIAKGKAVIQKFDADGGTEIMDSLKIALHLAQVNLKKHPGAYQPMIIFLTDGQSGNQNEVTKTITTLNKQRDHVPIFSLSFGEDADRVFLRTVALQNLGFSRHIYEASDAALQLQEFYKQISSPLLSNVNFKYTSPVKDVSKNSFPIYFRGGELVVAGRYEGDDLKFTIDGQSEKGPKTIKSISTQSENSLERLWAYLTIKQKLQERDLVEDKSNLTKEALELALRYSFVTDVTSLVVVKPEETAPVEPEDSSDTPGRKIYGPGYAAAGTLPYKCTTNICTTPFPFRPPAATLRPQSIAQLSSASGGGGYSLSSQSYVRTSLIASAPPRKVYGPGYAAAGLLPYKCTTSVCTTPFVPPVWEEMAVSTTSTTESESFRTKLNWIDTVLNPNGTINILGGTYELGENEHIVPSVECHGTPLNVTDTGLCALLNDCSESYPHLPDFHTYENYACVLENKYAGVCCPKKSVAEAVV